MWLFVQAFQHIEKSRLTQQQIEDSYRFGLKLSDYTDGNLIPIPITTDLNGTDIMDWVLFKPFGRINIEDNDAKYVEKKLSEKRHYY